MYGRRGAYIKGCIFLASDLLVPDVCTDRMVQKWLPWPRGGFLGHVVVSVLPPELLQERPDPRVIFLCSLLERQKAFENS